MSDYIQGFQTVNGKQLYDYKALGNLPTNHLTYDEQILTSEQQAQVQKNLGINELPGNNSKEVFFVNLVANGDVYSIDKNYNELLTAYQSGQLLYCNIPDEFSNAGTIIASLYNFADDGTIIFDATASTNIGVESYFVIITANEDGENGVDVEYGTISHTIPTIPEVLPNPYTLFFTGAVSGEYDGSSEITIDIPAGGAEVETVLSDNLFDKSIAVANDKIFYHGSTSDTFYIMGYAGGFYAYVELRGSGTYRLKASEAIHGEKYALRIPLVDGTKTFIRNAAAVWVDSSDTSGEPVAEFTVTAKDIADGATYICYDGAAEYLDSLMIVKDRDYPTEYIPYGYIEVATDNGKKMDNVLMGKTAVFLGDSICAGTTVGNFVDYEGYGWAGLIGEPNKMNWFNYGRNGGTVTELDEVKSELWLTTQTDKAIVEHPKADYVIFEGGCNDADRMKDEKLGEVSSDYATFNTTTFSGAFESLILKILTEYPKAKIGYIVPQKMNKTNDHTAKSHIYRRFFDRAVEICEKWGIPYIDLWKGCPLNPVLNDHYDSSLGQGEGKEIIEAMANEAGKFYTDGQHLTLAGYKRITPQIEAFMRSL